MLRSLACPLVTTALLCPSLAAQWSAHPGAPAVLSGSADQALLLDDGQTLSARAFGAPSAVELGPSGTPVQGASARLVLFGGLDDLAIWDAGAGLVVPLGVTGAVWTEVRDELAVVLTEVPSGEITAHAWSARDGSWSSQLLGVFELTGFDVVVSDVALIARVPSGYFGFGVSSGAWGELAIDPVGDFPEIGGHVGGARLFDPSTQLGTDEYAAFSGHTATWDVSADLHFSSLPLFARDSIGVRIETPVTQRYRAGWFDGFQGSWLESELVHTNSTPIDLTQAHLHVIEDVTTTMVYEIYAPLSGDGPRTIAGELSLAAIDDDLVVIDDASVDQLFAWSSLEPGVPVPVAYTGSVVEIGSGRALSVFRDDAFLLHGFSAERADWASTGPLSPPLGDAGVGRDAAVVSAGAEVLALSASGDAWVPLGVGAGADEVFVSDQLAAALVAGRLWFFDARHSVWRDGGEVLSGTQLLLAGDHLISLSDASSASPALAAWSSQRPGWQTAVGVAGPIAAAPTLGPRLSWVVDAAGDVWSFGSAGAVEVATRWPRELDPALSPETAGSSAARLVGRLSGLEGEVSALLVDVLANPDGLVVPGFGGVLELGGAPLVLGDAASLGAGGSRAFEVPVPPGLPVGLELWLQSVLIDPLDLSLRFGEGVERLQVL